MSVSEKQLTPLQLAVLCSCFLLNMLDGMDVMVISYAAPAIAGAWSTSPQALGGVFSAALAGMATGAMLLAPLADRWGRRPIILLAVLLMGLSVWATSWAQSVGQLVVFRFISGIGVGAVLANTATIAAEYAPERGRAFWVSFVMSGYPVGAVLSGMVAAKVIPAQGWPAMFVLAGGVTLITLLPVWFLLTESLEFLLKRQPPGALVRANRILEKMNASPLDVLPRLASHRATNVQVAALLTPERKTSTLRLWLGLFMAFATLYFLTTWIPRLASGAGLPLALAIYAGTVFNFGAFAGILTQGWLSGKFGLERTIFSFLVATAGLMAVFGFFKDSVWVLPLFGLIGFGIQGGFVGLYTVAAQQYPAEIRSTGVGWAMGAGRIGAIVGPLLGGFLIGLAGLSLTGSFLVFAIPALAAAFVIGTKSQ